METGALRSTARLVLPTVGALDTIAWAYLFCITAFGLNEQLTGAGTAEPGGIVTAALFDAVLPLLFFAAGAVSGAAFAAKRRWGIHGVAIMTLILVSTLVLLLIKSHQELLELPVMAILFLAVAHILGMAVAVRNWKELR